MSRRLTRNPGLMVAIRWRKEGLTDYDLPAPARILRWRRARTWGRPARIPRRLYARLGDPAG